VYKTGLLKGKKLVINEIEKEMKINQDLIVEYSKNLEPGTEKDLFIGVAIVVLTK